MINGHGDDTYQYEGITSDFSSNICVHDSHRALMNHLAAHPELISHYPQPEAWSLEKMIAEHYKIAPQNVIVTSGATEAIYLIAQTFGMHPVIPTPTFSEYEDACNMFPRSADIVDIGSRNKKQDTMLWLCNPNNPTGEVYDQLYIDRMMAEYDLLVLDLSYENYTDAHIMNPRWGCRTPYSIQIHSMTKSYAVPGLRLGYVTASARVISRLREQYRPWAINALSLEAGNWLVQRGETAIPDLSSYLAETQRLRAMLNEMEGIEAQQTKTNFFLCTIQQATAAELKEYLAHKHGILIRDASNFTGLTPHHFRIATQSPAKNDALVMTINLFQQIR